MPLCFDKIVNADRLKDLLDAYYAATGIPTGILTLDGGIVVKSGWQKICSEFHRKCPGTEALCIQSDIKAIKQLAAGSHELIYQCPLGLIDAATPIMVNGNHIANLFVGQCLFEAPNPGMIARFKNQAAKWNFDEKSYVDALGAVPVIRRKRLKSILQFLNKLAVVIGDMGSSQLNLEERDLALSNANTKLKHEIKLRGKETEKLNQILETNPIPTFVIDSTSKVTHWNRACEELTEIPANEIIGTNHHRQTFYSDRRDVMADFIVKGAGSCELALQYGAKYRSSRRVRNGYEGEGFFPKIGEKGKWLFFTAAPLKSSNGDILGAIETIQDITERRQAEKDLLASESRYRQLFESANDAIVILRNGHIVDCNQKSVDLFNTSKDSLIGSTTVELSPECQPGDAPSKDEAEKRRSLVLQNGPQFFEWRFARKDGSQFDAEVSLTRFKFLDSPHALAIVRDITDRKKMIMSLKDRQHELDEKSSYLEKVNQALKASLDNREIEKRAVEENLAIDLKRFVFPYLDAIGKCKISMDAKAYLDVVETNLNDLICQYSRTVFSNYINLTPTEIRIADFIRGGNNTKETAEILGLSPSSVKWHRKNIRQKLGLNSKKINLHTYLNTLSG